MLYCRFGTLLEEWRDKIDGMIGLVGFVPPSTPPEDDIMEEESTMEGEEGGEGGANEGEEEAREAGEEEEEEEEEKGMVVEEDEELNRLSLEELCSEVEVWSSSMTYAVDNKDSRRLEEVCWSVLGGGGGGEQGKLHPQTLNYFPYFISK